MININRSSSLSFSASNKNKQAPIKHHNPYELVRIASEDLAELTKEAAQGDEAARFIISEAAGVIENDRMLQSDRRGKFDVYGQIRTEQLSPLYDSLISTAPTIDEKIEGYKRAINHTVGNKRTELALGLVNTYLQQNNQDLAVQTLAQETSSQIYPKFNSYLDKETDANLRTLSAKHKELTGQETYNPREYYEIPPMSGGLSQHRLF